MYIIEVSF